MNIEYIYLFNKYIVLINSVPQILLGTEDIIVNKAHYIEILSVKLGVKEQKIGLTPLKME